MAKKNPNVAALARIARSLAGAKPLKRYGLLQQAFVVFAGAGDVPRAEAVIRLAYEPVAPPDVVHALGTGPMDGLLRAADRPDLTRGLPIAANPRAQQPGVSADTPRDERVRVWEARVRRDLTRDAYGQLPIPEEDWRNLAGTPLWRRAQILARPLGDGALPATEGEALAALTRYLDAWCSDPAQCGAGNGQEMVLGVDLALRHGADVSRWVGALGGQLFDWLNLIQALCLPAVAKAISGGLLREVVGLTDAQRAEGLALIEQAAGGARSTAPTHVAPGRAIKRTVSAEYSQFYLEHADRKVTDADLEYFQDEREHAQGMSIFPGRVAIGTPSETSECDVEIKVESQGVEEQALETAARAVSFPLTVHGPLVLRSVASSPEDENPFEVPSGDYDVLAIFRAGSSRKKKKKRDGLRRFAVTLTMAPPGAFAAPRCVKLEDGAEPSARVFVNS